MVGKLQKVLFLCIHNTARSQMAEGYARHLLSHQYEIHSAGSNPVDKVHPMAVAAMAEVGIDISNQKPKSLDKFDLNTFDLVITLCEEEICPILPNKIKRLNWHLTDPTQQQTNTPEDLLRKFRKVRDDIKKLIQGLNQIQVW